MPDTLAATIKASLDWIHRGSIGLGSVTDSSRLESSIDLAQGTGAGQCDKLWHASRTLASGADDDLDLSALTATLFGSTVTVALAKVRGLLVVNLATALGEDLILGGAASNEWAAPLGAAGDKARCPAGSCLLLSSKVAGFAVSGGSKTLRIHNSGAAAIDYQIVIVGTSA